MSDYLPDSNPTTQFGLVAPEVAAGIDGLDFLRGMMDGTYPAPPFSQTADIWITTAEAGRVVFEGMPSRRFYNPMGIVHGGWLAMLLDTAMGCVVHSALKAGQSYTTIEMKTAFLRPVSEKTGKLRCEAVLLHRGNRIAAPEAKMFDGAGKLIAYGSETCSILEFEAGRR